MNAIFLTGFKLIVFNCLAIAEERPEDLVRAPANGTDMAEESRKFHEARLVEHACYVNSRRVAVFESNVRSLFFCPPDDYTGSRMSLQLRHSHRKDDCLSSRVQKRECASGQFGSHFAKNPLEEMISLQEINKNCYT